MILRLQDLRHSPVGFEEPGAFDPPVPSGGVAFIRVHGHVRPMEAADADVEDARAECASVVSGDANVE
jgi:hypothetical protein